MTTTTRTKQQERLRAMIEVAIMVALATVLSMIKLYELPLGGSITLLSMLPISVLSIRLGLRWGLCGGFLHGTIQLFLDLARIMTWGLTPVSLVGCFLFDYLVAFSAIGLDGILRQHGRGGFIGGIAFAMLIRFCSHLISGTLIFDAWLPDGWSNPFFYSVCYNGSYMRPEIAFTVIAAMLLTKTPTFRRLLVT